MADADVLITAGTGTKVDTRTVGAGTDEHRQVVVIGDPSTAANVATVDANGASKTRLVDGAGTAITTGVQYVGDAAATATPTGTVVMGLAKAAAPTDVSADNDAVAAWRLRNGAAATVLTAAGALISGDATNGLDVDVTRGPAPHALGVTIAGETAQFTTTQTSTILGPTNAAGVIMYITSIQIQAGGTVAGAVQVYYGTGAYSRGTSLAIFDGEFAPSATLKPGVIMTPFVPYVSVAGDECRVTTSAAINPLTVTIWYYLI